MRISWFAGWFAACCAALLAAPVSAQVARKAPPSAPPTGRYTIVHSPHVQKDTVLLDTATGKTWILVEDTSRDAFFWSPLARKDNDEEVQDWMRDHPVKAAPSGKR